MVADVEDVAKSRYNNPRQALKFHASFLPLPKISGRRKQYPCNVFRPQSDLANFLGVLDGLRSLRALHVLPSGVRMAVRCVFWIFCSLWILEQFGPSLYLAAR